jgi:hypothetical protein
MKKFLPPHDATLAHIAIRRASCANVADVLVLVALLALLAGLGAFTAIHQEQLRQADQVFVPFSSHSSLSNGTLALYEWANALGYRAERIENTAFRIDGDIKLLFVLAPRATIEPGEARYILQWVERGNVLFAADSGSFTTNGLFRELDIETDALDNVANRVALQQPLVNTTLPDLAAEDFSGLQTRRDDVVLYSAAGEPILLRLAHGKGTIWISAAPALLSNQNLSDANNAKFARALLASVPNGSAIAFDEYHLGFQPQGGSTLLSAVYNSPWGWGIFFAGLVVFGYLLLNGQRFGRTVPVQRTLARRTPSEYVVSMANLFRRANQRGMVLQHYRHALKRRLGRPFHLNPELSDERFIELITRMRPELDRAELVHILNGLRRTDATEADLVKSVAASVTFGARPIRK